MTGPFKIGTLARLTGLTPALLRAWERRYGLLSPQRGPGSQRLYSADDLRLLQYVTRQVAEGRSIGEISQPGREALLRRATDLPAPLVGQTVSSGEGLSRWKRQLLDAAMSVDAEGVSRTLDEVFAGLSTERAVDDVIAPVAIEVGELWAAGQCSVVGEHLISEQFLYRVRRLLESAQPVSTSRPVALAACFPDEQHQLGLAMLSWRLARRGVRVMYLGAAVPVDDLIRGIELARPSGVLLSVTRREHADAHRADIVARCAATARTAPVFIGGQGVAADVPRTGPRASAIYLRDLPIADVVDRVAGALH